MILNNVTLFEIELFKSASFTSSKTHMLLLSGQFVIPFKYSGSVSHRQVSSQNLRGKKKTISQLHK